MSVENKTVKKVPLGRPPLDCVTRPRRTREEKLAANREAVKRYRLKHPETVRKSNIKNLKAYRARKKQAELEAKLELLNSHPISV